MMRRDGIALAVVDAQVDRGDRDDDPARHPAGPAGLLTRLAPRRSGTRRGRSPPPRRRSAIPRRPAAGCARQARQRSSSAASTPCPSWPNTQAQGQGRSASCSATPPCELVPTSGTASRSRSAGARPSIRRSPKCAPMPARSTFGDHSAAVPLSASTCAEAERRGAAQDRCRRCRRPAGGRARRSAPPGRSPARPAQRHHEADAAPATRALLELANSASGSDAPRAPRALRQPAQRGVAAQAGSPNTRLRAGAARRAAARPGTGARLRARRSPALAVGVALSRGEPAQLAPAAGCRASVIVQRPAVGSRRALAIGAAGRAPRAVAHAALAHRREAAPVVRGRRRARAAPRGAPACA